MEKSIDEIDKSFNLLDNTNKGETLVTNGGSDQSKITEFKNSNNNKLSPIQEIQYDSIDKNNDCTTDSKMISKSKSTSNPQNSGKEKTKSGEKGTFSTYNVYSSSIDNNNIILICARKDANGNIIDNDYIGKEVRRVKKRNKQPVVIGLTLSGQRDLICILFENLQRFLDANKSSTKKFKKFTMFNSPAISKDKDFDFENFCSFFRIAFKCFEMELSTMVFSFIYLDRALATKKIVLTYKNIELLYMTCLNLAYNFNEDVRFSDKYYAKFLKLDLMFLQALKNIFLEEFLDWRLLVSNKEYKAYLSFPLEEYCMRTPKIKKYLETLQESSA